MAMAPPLTLTFSMSRSMSRTKRRTTAAKASLISTRSRSSLVRPALASAFLDAGAGPVSMIVGSAPERAVARMRALGLRPSSLPVFSLPIVTSAAPSTMPDELPGVWTWLIFSTQWYFCSATASKPPISPIAANDGLSLPSVSTVVPGRTNSSVLEHGVAVDVLHRDDRVLEAALLDRLRGALLRADGVGVDVVAAELLDGGDQVGGDALRDEVGVEVRLGVHRPGAAVGAHRDAAHRLDATGEDEVLPAGGDLLGGDVDGLEAGRAEAVELDAGDGVRQTGLDGGGLGDVAALVADRRHAAEHDVVDAAWDRASSLRLRVSCIRPTTRSTGFVVCSEPLLLPLPRGVRMASKTSASGMSRVRSSVYGPGRGRRFKYGGRTPQGVTGREA